MKDKIKVIRRLGGIFLALGMVCMVLLFLIPKTEEETNTQTQNLGNEQETQETQKTQETPETQKPSTKPQNMKIIYQLHGGYYISFFGEDGREEKREYYSKEAKNIKTCEFSYEIDEEKGLYQMTSSTQNEKGEVVSHVLYTCDSALRPLLSEHYR